MGCLHYDDDRRRLALLIMDEVLLLWSGFYRKRQRQRFNCQYRYVACTKVKLNAE